MGGIYVTYGPMPEVGSQIIVGGGPSYEQLNMAGDSLEAILVPFAGLPPGLSRLLRENKGRFGKVTVHSVHHNASFTAEIAVALCLAAAKLLIPADRYVCILVQTHTHTVYIYIYII